MADDERMKREEERLMRSLGKGSSNSQRLKEEAERRKKLEEKKRKEEEERKAVEAKKKEELRKKEEARVKALNEERALAAQNAPPPAVSAPADIHASAHASGAAPAPAHINNGSNPLVDTHSCIDGVFSPSEDAERLKKEEERMNKMFGIGGGSSASKSTASSSDLLSGPEKSEAEREEERMRKQFGVKTPTSNDQLPATSAKGTTEGETSRDISKPPEPPVYLKGQPVVPQGPATIGSAFESEVWSEMNKVRMNPTHYISHLRELEKNFEGNTYKIPGTDAVRKTVEGVTALYDAIKHLEVAKPCQVLELSPIFSKSASELVDDKGAKGQWDTKLSDGTVAAVRLLRHGIWKKKVAELVGLGAYSGKDAVLQWLLDDGNQSRSNRVTLLDSGFHVLGVSSGYHSKFHRITVACLANEFHTVETRHTGSSAPSGAAAGFTATEGELNIANFVLGASGTASRVELDIGESRTLVQVKILPSKYSSELQVMVKNENVLEVISKHTDEGGNHVVSTRSASLPTAITTSNFSIVSQTPQGITLKINKIYRK